MDRELAAGDRKDRGGAFRARPCCSSIHALGVESQMSVQPHGRMTAKRHHATSTRWPVPFVNSRTWRREPDVRTAPRPNASRFRAGPCRSSIRALGVESQMSVQPGGRMHLESRGCGARRRDARPRSGTTRRARAGLRQLQAAPLMLELGLGEGWLRPLASSVSNSCSHSQCSIGFHSECSKNLAYDSSP
jgi:hypothetical protein